MGQLKQRLDAANRQQVVDDVITVIDNEVEHKSGLSGLALKAGYKVVKKLRGGQMIANAADSLLDPFTTALEPLYEAFLGTDGYDAFAAYLSDHPDQATQSLLSITDGKAKRADSKVIKKTYNKLRGQAEGHVEDALPAVGRLIDKHAPKASS